MLQLSEAGYVSLGLMTTQEEEEEGAWVVGSLTTTTLQSLPLRQLIQGRQAVASSVTTTAAAVGGVEE